MTKQLTIGAAIGALMVSGALAQTPSPPTSPGSSPPAAATPSQSSPSQSSSSQSSSSPAGEKADFVMSQKPDQWLASKFKGTDVMGPDNLKIGDVSDILFDKTGKIEAFVVAVGGFLGMGAKEIALAPGSFDVVPGQNGSDDKLKLSMSQDQLKNAQAFARYEPPRPTTTGAGGAMGGGPRPSTNTPPTGR
jgi:hypothetical protein